MIKKLSLLTLLPILVLSTGCSNPHTTIRICASQLPHAKILQEVVAPIVQEKGYTLNVKVLDWTIQNSVLAAKEYDANYFQHIPYLETYTGSVSLVPACKVHYEKLCVYKGNDSNGIIENGESIVLVNDVSNIERSLKLLQFYNILTINDSCYTSGSFDFDSLFDDDEYDKPYNVCSSSIMLKLMMRSNEDVFMFVVMFHLIRLK